MELKEYRKRLSLNVTGASHSPPQAATQPRGYSNGSNDFSFAFPKFGDLPGSYLNNGSLAKTSSPPQTGQRSASSSNTTPSDTLRKTSSSSTKPISPTSFSNITASPISTTQPQAPTNGSNVIDSTELSGLFSPSILAAVSRANSNDYMSYPASTTGSTNSIGKSDSMGSVNGQGERSNMRQTSSTSILASPASSMSHALDSSCGTTPESSAESPDNRKASEGVLNTIAEENKATDPTGGKKAFCDEWATACGSIANPVPRKFTESDGPPASSNFVKSPVPDFNNFDWMAQQNGGQFDPVLFGDYRDPQDNILNTFGDYFNDAFPINDFTTPYNTADFESQPTKRDFMKEIEVQRDGSPQEMVPGEEKKQYLGCEKLWYALRRRHLGHLLIRLCSRERVKDSEKAQAGEADMDDLCKQLKAKAKCSGKGAVIEQKDVDEILGPAPA